MDETYEPTDDPNPDRGPYDDLIAAIVAEQQARGEQVNKVVVVKRLLNRAWGVDVRYAKEVVENYRHRYSTPW
ncbi:MAG: hypothetical protein AB7I30_13150 [Isosphaeraceae bacterium]